jgi:maltose alpha-D-glucosyltransferase/alpha-amylase
MEMDTTAANDSASLLQWLVHMIKLRKSLPAIGWGNWNILPFGPQVLGLQYDWEGESIITLHNFGPGSQEVTIGKQSESCMLQNLLNNEKVYLEAKAGHHFMLKGYEYRWYRKLQATTRR